MSEKRKHLPVLVAALFLLATSLSAATLTIRGTVNKTDQRDSVAFIVQANGERIAVFFNKPETFNRLAVGDRVVIRAIVVELSPEAFCSEIHARSITVTPKPKGRKDPTP